MCHKLGRRWLADERLQVIDPTGSQVLEDARDPARIRDGEDLVADPRFRDLERDA